MTIFDFLWPRRVNLSNVQTDSKMGTKHLIKILAWEKNVFFAIQNFVDIQSSRFR